MIIKIIFPIFFLILILFPSLIQSQVQKNDLIVAASAKQVKPLGKPFVYAYGIEGQYFISERFSLTGSFLFNKNYAHIPLGFASVAFLFYFCDGCQSTNLNDNFVPLAALLFTEGVSYHIPVFHQFTFSPYINLLGLDYIYDKENYKDDFSLTSNLGFKMNLFFGKHIIVCPSAEYWRIYTDSKGGLGVGITVGYVFFDEKTNKSIE